MLTLLDIESRIPHRQPIREVNWQIQQIFHELDRHFDDLYAEKGRASIPPERLLGAKVLMALYTVRSDRQFCERLRYDLLFQWFLVINPDEPEAIFDASTLSKDQAAHSTIGWPSRRGDVRRTRAGSSVTTSPSHRAPRATALPALKWRVTSEHIEAG